MQSIVRRLSIGGNARDEKSASAQEATTPRASSVQSENEQAFKDMADMQRVQLEAIRAELDRLRAENEALQEELENVKGELEAERMPPQLRRLHGLPPKDNSAGAANITDQSRHDDDVEQLKAALQAVQSQLSDSLKCEQSSAAQLRKLSQENTMLRAAMDLQSQSSHIPPRPAAHSEPSDDQQAALRARVVELEAQVDEKQEHLAETAQLVEKMFSEFSALQVEFIALQSKGSVVPGDSHDVAALHAALESKDRQLESAASDMARMSMDYADLAEQLQMSKIERMQLQILCDDVVQEFDAASQKVPWLLRRMAQLLCFARTCISSYASLLLQWDSTVRSLLHEKMHREQQAAAAKMSELVDGRASVFTEKRPAVRGQ